MNFRGTSNDIQQAYNYKCKVWLLFSIISPYRYPTLLQAYSAHIGDIYKNQNLSSVTKNLANVLT